MITPALRIYISRPDLCTKAGLIDWIEQLQAIVKAQHDELLELRKLHRESS